MNSFWWGDGGGDTLGYGSILGLPENPTHRSLMKFPGEHDLDCGTVSQLLLFC